MPKDLYKLAFIGQEPIHTAFCNMQENWDFQSPIETIDEFNKEMEKEGNSKISDNTSVIVVFSRLFRNNPEDFADFVAYYAPYAVVCILMPDQDRNMEPTIKSEIDKMKQAYASDSSDYEVNAPYYFIRYEDPYDGIVDSIKSYISSPFGGKGVQEELRHMIPGTILDEDLEDYSDDTSYTQKEIILPDADIGAKGKVISVTSSKGGSGKSTVAMVLAAYLAESSIDSANKGLEASPLKVCVVDLDTRDGQLNLLNGANTGAANIFDIYVGYDGVNMDEPTIRKGIYTSDKMHCDFIFAVKRPRHADNIPPQFYADLIQKLRSMYDYIILDTSVNYLDPLLEKIAYPLADQILFVSDMGISSIVGMARWIYETTEGDDNRPGINKDKIGIVINKAMPKVNMDGKKIEDAASGCEVVAMLPSVPTIITYAANTNSLKQILTVKQINESFQALAEIVTAPSGYKLGSVPFKE